MLNTLTYLKAWFCTNVAHILCITAWYKLKNKQTVSYTKLCSLWDMLYFLSILPVVIPRPNKDESLKSHSHLAWNSHTLFSDSHRFSFALIKFEPAQNVLESCLEFSLVWPCTLDDSWWELMWRKLWWEPTNSQQLSSHHLSAC